MGEVRDAIILAGGMGTRMLPASLYAPKEMMPLIDTPVLNHLVWEAAKAGVSRVHLVVSEEKMEILSRFFQDDPLLGQGVRDDLPRDSLSLSVKGIEVIPHIQIEAGGIADAISAAIDRIKGPFLVLLGDMLMMENHVGPKKSGSEYASGASMKLVSVFEETGLPCVGVYRVNESEVSKYGVVELSEGRIVSISEKPSASEALSNYVLCGRYLFPENTSSILEGFPLSEFGEMQSIFLLSYLIDNGGLNAVKLDEMEMYDSGDPFSWLKSQIDHGLRRDDISEELFEWLSDRLSRI